MRSDIQDFQTHWAYSYQRLYALYAKESQLFIELPDFSFFEIFYTESERKYHNYEHICYLMELHNCLLPPDLAGARECQQIELFIWFHDVIYSVRDPGQNEEKSAYLFETVYRKWVFTNAVRDAIIGSRHLPEPIIKEPWALYCLDLDLAAMGDPDEDRWMRNNALIREENRYVQDYTYNCNRHAFFTKLLARGFIYHNPYALEWFTLAETRAKQRIELELTRLKGDIREYEVGHRNYLTNR